VLAGLVGFIENHLQRLGRQQVGHAVLLACGGIGEARPL
jgi:hypothetical protein